MADTRVRNRAGSVPFSRVKAAAAVTAVVGATVLAGAPIATAAPATTTGDPSSSIDPVLRYGATYAAGMLRWHQRSVDVDYLFKASNCRRLYVYAYDADWKRWPARSTSLHCNDVTSSTINVPVDIAGGPRWVDLCFRDETDSEQQLACEGYPHP
ncbi:hypothetical protein ACFVYA_48100 [Amycolatopsis sp. NPDC058278]|uniref:hypothetical protein n=1 Tax=Amycolatopsis sp. NPDC058278 TaxID=3346417 RepID=UPI0036DE399E